MLNVLRSYPVRRFESSRCTGLTRRLSKVGVLFLQSLNHFQRYAYVRQAHAREAKLQLKEQQVHLAPPVYGRANSKGSNTSETSLNDKNYL